jgi:hypothetical protein
MLLALCCKGNSDQAEENTQSNSAGEEWQEMKEWQKLINFI